MTWAIFCNSKETQKTNKDDLERWWNGYGSKLMFEQYSVAQKTKTHNVNLQRWWKDYSSKPNHCFVVIYYTDNFCNILWMWKWMWSNHDRLSIKIPCGPGRPLAPCGPSCPGSPFSPLSPPGPFPPAPPLFPIFCQYKNINYQ